MRREEEDTRRADTREAIRALVREAYDAPVEFEDRIVELMTAPHCAVEIVHRVCWTVLDDTDEGWQTERGAERDTVTRRPGLRAA